MRTMRRILGIAATITLAGCTTVFTGAAKVTNGPAGCRASCDAWGMDLAGMVKMGEYSDGCICQVRPAAGAAAPAPRPAGEPSADASGAGRAAGGPQAVAGVWAQMQAAAAAAAQQTATNRQTAQHGSPGWRPGLH